MQLWTYIINRAQSDQNTARATLQGPIWMRAHYQCVRARACVWSVWEVKMWHKGQREHKVQDNFYGKKTQDDLHSYVHNNDISNVTSADYKNKSV